MNCNDLLMGTGRHLRIPPKILLVMKLTTFLLLITILTVSATTNAQKITLNQQHAQLIDILDQISQQSGYNIVGDVQLLKTQTDINVNLKDANIQQALDQTLEGLNLTYKLDDKTILIKPKEKPTLLDNVKAYLTSIDVTGTVVDENGQPLNQATVKTKDSKQVTTTDVKGNFTLNNVDPNATLTVSFIGYEDQQLKPSANLGTIKMKVSTNPLNEVKVIAYGTTTGRLSVGDVSSINAKQIESQPVNNPLFALQGQVPGIVITPISAAPGGAVRVQIEGQNSLTSGTDPLYVIDGVPYNAGMPGGTLGNSVLGGGGSGHSGTFWGNPMAYINPDDLENISILKDADATAIYGARAANGAILITTKKGKAGVTKVDLNIKRGFSQVPHFMDLMNTQQYLKMRHEAFANDGTTPDPNYDYDLTLWDTTKNNNWQKALLGGTAHYQDYNIDVSGGNNAAQFLIGATYHSDGTIWSKNTSNDQTGVHFSFNTASQSQKFHMMLTGTYSVATGKLPLWDPGTNVLNAPDAPPLYNNDGSINWGPIAPNGFHSYSYNQAQLTDQTYHSRVNNLISSLTISYQLTKELDFKVLAGYTNMEQDEVTTIPTTAIDPDYFQYGFTNSANYSNANANGWNIDPQAHYQKVLGKNKLDVLFGGTVQQNNNFSTNYHGQQYATDEELQNPGAATTLTTGGTNGYIYRYNALLARVNYNYDDRYILELTGNRDGSSRFGANNEFANFWSIAGGWLFSNEKFIKEQLSWLSTGKIRFSYGLTGNDQIADYGFLSQYYPSIFSVPYQGTSSYFVGGLPNPDLQWEDDRKLNLGVDIGLFKDRLFLGVNASRNQTSNQLINYQLPIQTGYVAITKNFPATIQNTTLEITFRFENIQTKNFSWVTSGNVSIPNDKLIAFPNIAQTSYSYLNVGEPFLGVTPVFRYAGVNPQTGVYQFYTHDGTVTSNPDYTKDRTDTVNTNPKFYGGLTNSLRYKSFELNFTFSFNKVTGQNLFFGETDPGFLNPGASNQPTWLMNGVWQKPGDIAQHQRFNQDYSAGTAWGDAASSNAAYGNDSYLRLQNAQLSWSAPDSWSKKLGMNSLRIFVQGQNLFTFTSYKGIDPQDPGSYFSYSTLRTISFGIHVGF